MRLQFVIVNLIVDHGIRIDRSGTASVIRLVVTPRSGDLRWRYALYTSLLCKQFIPGKVVRLDVWENDVVRYASSQHHSLFRLPL